jgi:hypothetical protein
MTLRKIALLFIFLILIGCNQSDSNSNAPSVDNTDTKQSQPSLNDNTSAVETEPERKGKVLARVNGQPIYEDAHTRANLESYITEEIIYQEGIVNGYAKSDRDRVRDFERRVIIATTKQNILENAEPTKEVSSEDIENYYESNKDKYTRVRIHEMSFPDGNLGNEIKDKIKSGEELQAIANSYPDMPITVNDISYNKAIAGHFAAIEVGSVSEVIKKPDGKYSVLKIVEIKEIPLNKTSRSIKYILKAKRKAEMFNSYAQNVVEENSMTIEIFEQDSKQ